MYDKMFSPLYGQSLTSNRSLCWVAIFLLYLALSLSNFPGQGQNLNFTFHNNTSGSVDQLIFVNDSLYLETNSSIVLNSLGSGTGTGNDSQARCGRMLFQERVQLVDTSSITGLPIVASFGTVFTFSIEGPDIYNEGSGYLHGDGFSFTFSADNVTEGDSGGTLCLIRNAESGYPSNHMFAVEFDTYMNTGNKSGYFFNDPSNNHVGVDDNSVISKATYNLCGGQIPNCTYLVNGGYFTAWINYASANQTLEVRLSEGSTLQGVQTPSLPLIQQNLDLSQVLNDNMYVGFVGSTGSVSEVCFVNSWSFVSSGMSKTLVFPTGPTPSPIPSPGSDLHTDYWRNGVGIITVIVVPSNVLLAVSLGLCILGCLRKQQGRYRSDYAVGGTHFLWPREFSYKELSIATKNFSEDQLLGSGGFGQVYKGIFSSSDTAGSHAVAVKRITHDSKQGEREFLAEISIISQIRHRNLVQLHGWCRENDKLLLVYEYMPNGSLDQWLFVSKKANQKKRTPLLAWDLRHNIVKGLAAALGYLHGEWEQCILHRDIKASNVMLDEDFNAHLGDFGLARLIDHDSLPKTTAIAETLGYLAPEIPHTGKASKKSDFYSFGVLALEIACGRHVFDQTHSDTDNMLLLDYVWQACESQGLITATELRLQSIFDIDQMKCVLQLGLLCCHPDPDARPTMRFIHQCLIGEACLPALPPTKPMVKYSLSPVAAHDDSSTISSVQLQLRVEELTPGDSDFSSGSSFSRFPSIVTSSR